MNRQNYMPFWMCSLVLTAAFLLRTCRRAGGPKRHPNIVLIVADDLGYGETSAAMAKRSFARPTSTISPKKAFASPSSTRALLFPLPPAAV